METVELKAHPLRRGLPACVCSDQRPHIPENRTLGPAPDRASATIVMPGNWCGKSDKFRWLITNADQRATSQISIPPPCQSSTSPSALTLLYNGPSPKPPRSHRV
jgi:hypothetical protein